MQSFFRRRGGGDTVGRKTAGRTGWALAALLALVLCGAGTLTLPGASAERVPPGVSVAGVDLSGCSRGEAEALLRDRGADYSGTKILLCSGDTLITSVTCGQIGAAPDWAKAAELACRAGQGDSLLRRWWRRLFPEAIDIAPPFTVDQGRLEAVLPPSPTDAAYDPASGEIQEGRPGLRVEAPALCRSLSKAAPGGAVRLPVEVRQPEISAEHLREALFRDVLGTYQTEVGGSASRRGNVALSAAAVDTTVLLPGETFDYNQVVGERTRARGYGAAPAYVNGETVEEIGGGICQTSSTLYAAALLADLQITARSAHRYVSSYIPLGMDATVSWGGPEFCFRNDTRYPIQIQAAVEGRTLRVTIRGTRLDSSTVKIRSEVVATDPCLTRYEDAPGLPAGTEQLKQSGYSGCTVQTYREVYDAEGNLLRSSAEARSVYWRRDKIVLRGTAVPPEDERVETGEEDGGLPSEVEN